MSKKDLQRHLDELRREIESSALNGEGRARLEQLADELEGALGEDQPDYDSVRERVEAAMLAFEADHPGFARLLSEVTDTLAKLGI